MSFLYDKVFWKKRAKTVLITMGWLLVLSLLTSGCGTPPTQEPEPTRAEEDPISTPTKLEPDPAPVEREPFSARAESGDGIIVSWSGYTNGYLPGKDDSVEITLENQTDQPWNGRFCILLKAGLSPTVISTLVDQEFRLDSGTGFTDLVIFQIPETVEDGSYGLTLVVHKPVVPLVAHIPIQIGETETARNAATQGDLEAALAACPPLAVDVDQLVDRAKALLNQEKNIPLADIEFVSVETYDFPDASLGISEPGQVYAQVITPGYIIDLQVGVDHYIYHATQNRIVLAETRTPVALHQTIEVSELGISFEIPGSWQPANGDMIWVPEPDSDLKLGFTWLVLQPPQ